MALDRDTLATIATHIFTLDEALLAEYQADGFDADHLRPGDRVWLDGDLYRTASEIEDEIHALENSLRDYAWADEERRREDLAELREALLLLSSDGE